MGWRAILCLRLHGLSSFAVVVASRRCSSGSSVLAEAAEAGESLVTGRGRGLISDKTVERREPSRLQHKKKRDQAKREQFCCGSERDLREEKDTSLKVLRYFLGMMIDTVSVLQGRVAFRSAGGCSLACLRMAGLPPAPAHPAQGTER